MNFVMQHKQLKALLDEAQKSVENREYEKAITLLEPLIEDLRHSGYINHLSEALLNIGVSFMELNQIKKSKAYFEEGLKVEMGRRRCNESRISSFLHELSLIAYVDGQLEESISLCEEAIRYAIRRPIIIVKKGFVQYQKYEIGSFSINLHHLAILYQETKQLDKAGEVLEILRVNCERNYDLKHLGGVLNELGLLYCKRGNLIDGIRYLKKSIEIKKKIGDEHGIQLTLQNLFSISLIDPVILLHPDV